MQKVYIYKSFERFWHWGQAALIIFLLFSGFEVHSSYNFLGFERAVLYHNIAGWALIALYVLSFFWHIVTGEWRQYIPTTKNLVAQIEYYLIGIFKNAPHPSQKSLSNKLNPLQRIVYLGINLIIIPLMILSGLTYLFNRYQSNDTIKSLNFGEIGDIATIHTIGAFLLVMFLIVHLYLITTGHTVTAGLRGMLTGYEELEENKEENKK
ncbi:MAG: cytochrome b/b6 domain-containing protein [Bacteroidota bacterium]|nr:cytochrome b/b6 domain-containing protein [Bacteroidota bacterium]